MKKTILIILLVSLLSMTTLFAESVNIENAVDVIVNGETLDTFDRIQGINLPAFIYNDRTMMPLRKTFEVFGIKDDQITWLAEERAVLVTTNSFDEIWMQIDNPVIRFNQNELITDVPAKIFDNRTYIPIAMVSALLGEVPVWDSESRSVLLNPDTYILSRSAMSFELSRSLKFTFNKRTNGQNYQVVKMSEDTVSYEADIEFTVVPEHINIYFNQYLDDNDLSSENFGFYSESKTAYKYITGDKTTVIVALGEKSILIEATRVDADVLSGVVESLEEVVK